MAASDDSHQHHEHDLHQQTIGYGTADKDTPATTPSNSIRDKLKGFVNTVKEGASDALDALDEKRKEAVAGTKKLMNKIKDKYDSYKNGNSEEDSPKESSEEQTKYATGKAKDAVVDKTQNFMKSEKLN